jgi:hypothetical protein
MGLLIDIKKDSENIKEATYSFFIDYEYTGKVSINKKTGECFVIEEPEYDKESKLAVRVGSVLVEHWRKGEFPDITCWAS